MFHIAIGSSQVDINGAKQIHMRLSQPNLKDVNNPEEEESTVIYSNVGVITKIIDIEKNSNKGDC